MEKKTKKKTAKQERSSDRKGREGEGEWKAATIEERNDKENWENHHIGVFGKWRGEEEGERERERERERGRGGGRKKTATIVH